MRTASLLRRILRRLGVRRKTVEDVVADRAARREFFDDTHGVIDCREWPER